MATSKTSYKGPPPKYLNDFSKALASEVRVLLAEVGKLRDERRALQYEIAELMSVKSKHGAGGEYAPHWKPPMPEEGKEDGPPEEGTEKEEVPAAKPAWRVVGKRPERTPRERKAAKAAAAAAAAGTSVSAPTTPGPTKGLGKVAPSPPEKNVPTWATWRPNPLVVPTPRMANGPLPAGNVAPRQAGLFGPPSPPPA